MLLQETLEIQPVTCLIPLALVMKVCKKCWKVDHIIPVSSFDLSDPEQVKVCFHYTNLQPLFVEENQAKSNKTPEEWAAYCALNQGSKSDNY
jgi:hypothetical protein